MFTQPPPWMAAMPGGYMPPPPAVFFEELAQHCIRELVTGREIFPAFPVVESMMRERLGLGPSAQLLPPNICVPVLDQLRFVHARLDTFLRFTLSTQAVVTLLDLEHDVVDMLHGFGMQSLCVNNNKHNSNFQQNSNTNDGNNSNSNKNNNNAGHVTNTNVDPDEIDLDTEVADVTTSIQQQPSMTFDQFGYGPLSAHPLIRQAFSFDKHNSSVIHDQLISFAQLAPVLSGWSPSLNSENNNSITNTKQQSTCCSAYLALSGVELVQRGVYVNDQRAATDLYMMMLQSTKRTRERYQDAISSIEASVHPHLSAGIKRRREEPTLGDDVGDVVVCGGVCVCVCSDANSNSETFIGSTASTTKTDTGNTATDADAADVDIATKADSDVGVATDDNTKKHNDNPNSNPNAITHMASKTNTPQQHKQVSSLATESEVLDPTKESNAIISTETPTPPRVTVQLLEPDLLVDFIERVRAAVEGAHGVWSPTLGKVTSVLKGVSKNWTANDKKDVLNAAAEYVFLHIGKSKMRAKRFVSATALGTKKRSDASQEYQASDPVTLDLVPHSHNSFTAPSASVIQTPNAGMPPTTPIAQSFSSNPNMIDKKPKLYISTADLEGCTPAPGTETNIGRWGEALVYQYCLREFPGLNVEWMNKHSESQSFYDIKVSDPNPNKIKSTIFIEVKATRYADKAMFEMSPWEYDFMRQTRKAGVDYHIYRVMCAGQDNRATIRVIPDAVAMLNEHKMNLLLRLL